MYIYEQYIYIYPISHTVGTNCSIIHRNPTGSSLTPTCPGSCFVLQVSITKVQIVHYGMPNSIYSKK